MGAMTTTTPLHPPIVLEYESNHAFHSEQRAVLKLHLLDLYQRVQDATKRNDSATVTHTIASIDAVLSILLGLPRLESQNVGVQK